MNKQQTTFKPTTQDLPYNNNLEQVILGALLVDKQAIYLARPLLFADAFANTAHQMIWTAISNLNEKGLPVDLIMVNEELKAMGDIDAVGGAYYLAELTQRVASSANLEAWIRAILEKWVRRQVIRIGHQMIQDAKDLSIEAFETLSTLQAHLMQIQAFLTVGQGKRLPELIQGFRDKILSGKALVDYLPTSISGLDSTLVGFIRSELCIVGGRPGSGKTTLTIAIICKLVMMGVPCAFFTYEMSTEQLLAKMLSNICEIDGEAMNKGELTEPEKAIFLSMSEKLERAPLKMEDGAGMNAMALKSKIITFAAEYQTQVVVIDYLTLIPLLPSTKGMSTADAIGETVRILKETAQAANLTIILLAQLSKETEANKWARPTLKNLRDSGRIEDNADRVLFVWRPHYHNYSTVEYKGEDIDTYGKACIIQAKFRHGRIGSTWLAANLGISNFSTLDDPYAVITPNEGTYTTYQDVTGDGADFGDDVPF